jgi:hypothetical protein
MVAYGEERKMTGQPTWASGTDRLVRKLRTASLVGMGYQFNAEGAGALANLIEDMAKKLDIAVKREAMRDDDRP